MEKMSKFRVSWIESRLHYIEIDAVDRFEAIEKAEEFEYSETARDESSYNNHTATILEDESKAGK